MSFKCPKLYFPFTTDKGSSPFIFKLIYNVPIITEFLSDFHILKEYMGKHSWRT